LINGGANHHLNAKVEELVQKRVLGTLTLKVVIVFAVVAIAILFSSSGTNSDSSLLDSFIPTPEQNFNNYYQIAKEQQAVDLHRLPRR
jgi:hypothetical protein